MKHTDIIQKLNLEQKCALLSGETVFTTRALPGKGIPAITLSDGPNGVRKQAGAADHLGLNPSVPATCFPTSSATACSWDEKLGEAVGEALGEEAAAQEVAVLLGPGLNIQRSPPLRPRLRVFLGRPHPRGQDGRCLCARHPEKWHLCPPPSTLRSTVRSCAAWPATRCSMSAPCGSCI